MIVHIIGWYCLSRVFIGEIALISSVIDKDDTDKMNAAFLAIAAWCFK